MARINFLPWREARRQARRKEFIVIALGAMLGAMAVVLLVGQYLDSASRHQSVRNLALGRQIATLDEQVAQFDELKAQRQVSMERLRVIQGLQGDRHRGGRILEQLVHVLVDGVYFTEVAMGGQTLSIVGVSQSNPQLAELMRKLAASDLFEAPTLEQIRATGGQAHLGAFQLTVAQARPSVAGGVQ